MTQMNKKLIQENKDLKSKFERGLTSKLQTMVQKEKDAELEKQELATEEQIKSLTSQV